MKSVNRFPCEIFKRIYHVHRLDLRYDVVSFCLIEYVGRQELSLPSSFSLTSSFLNSGTSLDMMAGLTLGCDVSYCCLFVVVDSGGVEGAMNGFLYALRGVQRVAPNSGKARRQSPSSGGR